MSTSSKRTITNATAPRTKQLTRLTVLMLTVLTILTAMPTISTAAAINAAKMSSPTQLTPNTATVLPTNTADTVLSDSQPAVLQQLIDSTAAGGQRVRRRRLRKRHNDGMRLSRLARVQNDAATTPPEWVNACAWLREDDAVPSGESIKSRREVVRSLRDVLRMENTTIHTLHAISIDDMAAWRKHSRKYRFLPTLNRTAKIDLHHWHRAMQKFAGSFADLGVKQYRWDKENLQVISDTTRELDSLLLSARRTLCQLESAIVDINPQAKIRTITREEMHTKLNFYSKDLVRVTKQGVDAKDLRFAKHRYSKYMQHMLQIVRRQLRTAKGNRKAHRATAKSMANSYSDESSSNSQWLDLSDLEGYDASAVQPASGMMSDEALLLLEA